MIESGMGVYPSVLKACHHLQQSEQIPMRKPFHGKILVQQMSMRTSCILQVISNVQLSKRQEMDKQDQEKYMTWIEAVLNLDRKKSKDERLYCLYCDMNNHPRFSCKHLKKHREEADPHRCTLCIARHAPFQCKRAQCNGGCAKPNWEEFKQARTEQRTPDFRWERDVPPPPLPPPAEAPLQDAATDSNRATADVCRNTHDAWSTSKHASFQFQAVSSTPSNS